MGSRGIVGDKWSMRILWACAIGSAVGLYMVAVERQMQNREKMMAESSKDMEWRQQLVVRSRCKPEINRRALVHFQMGSSISFPRDQFVFEKEFVEVGL